MTLTETIANLLKQYPEARENARLLDTCYLIHESLLFDVVGADVANKIIKCLGDPRLASPEAVSRAARRIKEKQQT